MYLITMVAHSAQGNLFFDYLEKEQITTRKQIEALKQKYIYQIKKARSIIVEGLTIINIIDLNALNTTDAHYHISYMATTTIGDFIEDTTINVIPIDSEEMKILKQVLSQSISIRYKNAVSMDIVILSIIQIQKTEDKKNGTNSSGNK